MSDYYELAAMTSTEFASAKETIRLGLIPVGATEQHGGNLALSTDYIVGHRLAQRLAMRLHPRSVVAPPLPYGLSYHHTGFAGTMTLSPESFMAVCVDIAKSFQQNGIEHVLFVNGHNGNTAILNVITQKLVYECKMKAATCFYFSQAADIIQSYRQTERFGHACEIETSVLMELAPEYVRTDQLEPGRMKPNTRQFAYSNQPYALQVPIPFHEQTENGVFGDARLAKQAIGAEIVAKTIERTAQFVETFLESNTQ